MNGPRPENEYKQAVAQLDFEGQPFGAIHVRFKGHSSFRFARNSLKRSFKLDFNDVEKDKTFFGLTKLNLNNNAMDPSQIREALAYHLFRDAGVPAGRTAFAKVFITVPGQHDHAYAGLYTIVEQVDERFLKARFGTKHGLLLKPEQPLGSSYRGKDWSGYTNQLAPKSVPAAEEISRFIEFVQCLHFAEDAHFAAVIGEYVEVDELLRFLAMEDLLANLDSPLLTGHNYFVYLSPRTQKFTWIPWDMNEAFGGFGPGGRSEEQMNLNLDQPFRPEDRLAERLGRIPGIKDRYREITRNLLIHCFQPNRLFPVIDAMAATIRSALTNDPMVSLSEFDSALAALRPPAGAAEDSIEHPQVGLGALGRPKDLPRPRAPIKAFVQQRAISIRLQLGGLTNGFIPREMRPGPGDPSRRAELPPPSWP